MFTDGGWGTVRGAWLAYGGFPAAACLTAARVARFSRRTRAESVFWAFAALWAYAAWWLVTVAVYAVVAAPKGV